MTATALAIRRTALVTSVGLDAPSACAAIRARLTNPSETRFADPSGGWLSAHAVPLGRPLRGLHKLVEMAAPAIDECLADIPPAAWPDIPLLLCVAEPERPGRPAGLDDLLVEAIEQRLQARFAPASAIVPQGKVATAVALAAADRLLGDEGVPQVLVVATDSLITWPTLSPLLQADRLLTAKQSNGFIAGEAAGAVLLARPVARSCAALASASTSRRRTWRRASPFGPPG